jgi:hypothetical protein
VAAATAGANDCSVLARRSSRHTSGRRMRSKKSHCMVQGENFTRASPGSHGPPSSHHTTSTVVARALGRRCPPPAIAGGGGGGGGMHSKPSHHTHFAATAKPYGIWVAKCSHTAPTASPSLCLEAGFQPFRTRWNFELGFCFNFQPCHFVPSLGVMKARRGEEVRISKMDPLDDDDPVRLETKQALFLLHSWLHPFGVIKITLL